MRSPRILALSLLMLVALAITGCVPITTGITVKEPWSRAAMEGNNGAAFMIITNGTSDDDRVVSAESDVAAKVELHETVEQDGVMSMIHQPDGFPLPAGSSIELKPGGKHVMLMGLAKPFEPGQTYQLTLNFEKAGPIIVEVPVRSQ